MRGMCFVQAPANRCLEGPKIGVVPGVQTLLLGELPQPFNEVQIGRVCGEVQQLDIQFGGQAQDQGTFLIAGIVQHQTVSYLNLKTGDTIRTDTIPDADLMDMSEEDRDRVSRHMEGPTGGPGRPLSTGEGRRLWSCRLPLSTIEAIKEVAARKGISQSQVIIEAVGNIL